MNGARSIRRRMRKPVERLAGRAGYELVAKHFYSPIPDVDSLDPAIWSRRSPLAGVRMPDDAGLSFVREHLADLIREFRPPARPTADPSRFYLDNSLYETVDAEFLYAMVRHLRPKRVLELGSGMSTLVIAEALAVQNVAGGQHVVCDPYPRSDLPLADVADLRPIGATDVPEALIDELEEGDVLFVDTTHTVKLGGDVNHILLDILPRLAAGVVVHVHDIYLPFEYPREFVEERRFFWAEQHMLQAFLAYNDAFEVLVAAHALARDQPEALRALVPSFTPGARPSAFWMRRTEGP